jgi:hypothetical protein
VATATSLQGIIGNVTPAAGTFTTVTGSNDASLNGLTVGRGGGSIAGNTALGYTALAGTNSGSNANVAVGYEAMYTNTTGTSNAVVGFDAMYFNTTGSYNTAVGRSALEKNTTATYNTAVGYTALYSNTTGQNTAIGAEALYTNTTGVSNTAIGGTTSSISAALALNTTGSYNTAVGNGALRSNTTAQNNTALGYQAGTSTVTGAKNVFIGARSGLSATSSNNTMVGEESGVALTTGAGNTFVGAYNATTGGSGELITTGSKNTVLGSYNGNQGSLDIRTSNNMIVLSDGDGNPRMYCDGNGAFRIPTGRITVNGNLFTSGAQGYIEVEGDPASVRNLWASNNTAAGTGSVGFMAFKRNGTYTGGISQTDAATSYATSSDYRLKENVAPMTGALAKVSQLKPCTYTWKASGEASQGFIAHELAEVCPEAVCGEKDAVYEDGSIKSQGIDVSFLVATLTAAIQELKAEFDVYKSTHP